MHACTVVKISALDFSHNYFLFQLGVMIGLAFSPIIIHQADTVAVCGNESYTPSPSPGQFSHWSRHIHDRLFYYLLGQAVVSLIILLLTIIGTVNWGLLYSPIILYSHE
jgi:hypothetical protein